MIEKKKRRDALCWLLVAPALLTRAACSLYPILRTVYDGFFQINKIRRVNRFIGLGNYVQMFQDSNIRDTLQFTAVFTAISILLHTVIGVALALMLNTQFKGRKILRSVVLIPWATPLVVAGIAASWAFNDMYGFVNDLIRYLAPGFTCDWLVNPATARFAVIIVDVWKDTPFYAIMILAGLQSVPEDVYEAALADGSGPASSFFRITLPNIAPLMCTMTVFFSLWRLTQFDLVYAMTQGGPGTSTSLLSYRTYIEAFKNLNFGYASSISVVLCLFMVVVAVTGFRAKRRLDFES